MGILSGLKNFGIDPEEDIYKDNRAKKKDGADTKASAGKAAEASGAAAGKEKEQVQESSYLLAKSYECPVCLKPFKSLAVKANRSRVVGSDLDLRPIYEPVDTLKYTVVSCPFCGYSALTRNFSIISSGQKKIVREKICANFIPREEEGPRSVYTYEDALERYELALACAMAARAKSSEKAYLCLSMSWLVRGLRKSPEASGPENAKKLSEYKETERELQGKALEGFVYAHQNEDFPVCGNMDQYTVEYIISVLYFKNGEYDKSLRLLSNIMVAAGARNSIKDKARVIKDKIMKIRTSGVMPEEDEIED